MKNFIASLLVVSMLAPPVYAETRPSNHDSEIVAMVVLALAAVLVKTFDVAVKEVEHYQETRDIDKVDIVQEQNDVCDENGNCATTITVKTVSHKREKN